MNIFLLSMVFALAQQFSSPAWADQVPLPNGRINIMNVSLTDVAAAGATLVAVGERGLVMRSLDQGRTWIETFAPTDRTLTSVAFVDAITGVAVGHGGTVVRTDDGGQSWQRVSVADAGQDAILGITAMHDGRLVAYGAFALYIESLDKGKTWVRKKVVDDDFDRHISQVIEVGNKLLLVGESGTLAVSRDSGATWTRIASPYVGSFFGALLLGDGSVLIYGMRGNVFWSGDQGLSWTKMPFESKNTLNGGTVGPNAHIALVGNNGLIATSIDNGQTFTLHNSSRGTPIAKAIYAADGALVYVGYLDSGRIDMASPAVAKIRPATQKEKL